MKTIFSVVFSMIFAVSTVFAVDLLGLKFDLPWQKQDVEEFVNIETTFVFSSAKNGVEKKMTYGSRTGGTEGNYSLPEFKIGSEIQLSIELVPSLLENVAKDVRESEKSPKREIEIEVTIEKSKNVQVTQTGGMTPINQKDDVDGTSRFIFTIKNNPEVSRTVNFLFTPAAVGNAKISVEYRAADNGLKIVDKSCDVFQTVSFKK